MIFEQQTLNEKQSNSVQQPIRSYLRIFSPAGIDPATSTQYEILDGNCYLDKRKPNNLIVYPFNYIFTAEFDNIQVIQHMNIINDGFEGKNQYVIAEIEKQNMMNFIVGNCEEKGFIVELADLLFYETISHGLKTTKNLSSDTQTKIQTKQKLGISVFATEGNSNTFHDLIMGHKLVYFSKKDMDEYKNFYTQEITSIRQFFIVFKIALIHYRERCREGDPIIFKFSIKSYDEPNLKFYESTLHVIIAQRFSKIMSSITKKIEASLSTMQTKGEDHGSIANYFQRDLKKSKLIYLYGIPFRYKVMEESVDRFKLMGHIRQHSFIVTRNQILNKASRMIKEVNKFRVSKFITNTNGLNYKEVSSIFRLLNKLIEFLNEAAYKWKIYCQTINEITDIQQQFYEKQKFPVGLEIKDDSFKNFYISKVYKLSETFLIQDLTIEFEKLRTLKNQITLSLKSLMSLKQIANRVKVMNKSANSKDSFPEIDYFSSRTSNKNPNQLHPTNNTQHQEAHQSKYFNEFIRYFMNTREQLQKMFKFLFSFNFNTLKLQSINLLTDVSTQVFDINPLKQSMSRIKKNASKLTENTKEKQQIHLRKVRIEDLGGQSLQLSRNITSQLNESNSFDEYKRHLKQIASKKNMQKHNYNIGNKSTVLHQTFLLNKSTVKQKRNKEEESDIILENSSMLLESSTLKQSLNKYNFSLPKIAVIQRKKKIL